MAFGSHDSHIYCTDTNGRLQWKVKVDSPVYSTPFVFRFYLPQRTQDHREIVIHSESAAHRTKLCQDNRTENFQDCDSHSEFIHTTANNVHAVAGYYKNNSQSLVGDEKCENVEQKHTRQLITEMNSVPETNCADVVEAHTDLVAVCSTRGMLYVLTLATGAVLGIHQFEGEIFSSPVVLAIKGGFVVVVGCRDDYVYWVKFSRQAMIPQTLQQ